MININYQDKEMPGAARPGREVWAADTDKQSTEREPQPGDAETELEDVARAEREYVRRRLREEFKREPTEAEMDEWLRRQTEGY